MFTLMNSDDPDSFAIFALATIPPTVGSIYVTDQAWNGSHFLTNSGEVTLEVSVSLRRTEWGPVEGVLTFTTRQNSFTLVPCLYTLVYHSRVIHGHQWRNVQWTRRGSSFQLWFRQRYRLAHTRE